MLLGGGGEAIRAAADRDDEDAVGVGQQGVLESRFFLRCGEALLDPRGLQKITGSGRRNQFEHGLFYVSCLFTSLCAKDSAELSVP
jgi:hypothetical protein